MCLSVNIIVALQLCLYSRTSEHKPLNDINILLFSLQFMMKTVGGANEDSQTKLNDPLFSQVTILSGEALTWEC